MYTAGQLEKRKVSGRGSLFSDVAVHHPVLSPIPALATQTRSRISSTKWEYGIQPKFLY